MKSAYLVFFNLKKLNKIATQRTAYLPDFGLRQFGLVHNRL